MLITFKKTRTNTQAQISIPKDILEIWGIDENSSQEQRKMIVFPKDGKMVVEPLSHHKGGGKR